MSLTRSVGLFGMAMLLITGVLAGPSQSQGADKRRQFQVASTEEADRQAVIAKSRARKGQFDAFADRNSDGIFDAVTIPEVGTLDVDISLAEAQGFSYSASGDSVRRVVFYPAKEVRIPRDGEFLCYGFIHYFDEKQLSNWFAAVVYKVPGEDTPAALKEI
ncbi:MAG: hypothetical protein ABI743_13850, partial [bacterium]